jgi:glutaredoxin
MKVVMYSKDETICTFCQQAAAWLAARPRIPVEKIMLVTQDARDQLYDRLALQGEQRIMPQLFLELNDGTQEHIGDWKALQISGLDSLFG